MSIEILMPALSPTMSEGKLTKWFVKEGDEIKAGDLLAEIETDKAIMEFESSEDGIIKEILVQESENSIRVNEPIATLDNNELATTNSAKEESTDSSITPISISTEQEKEFENEPVKTTINPLEIIGESNFSNNRVKASPLAKKMAERNNLDLHKIAGSGPAGRIIKVDVEKYLETIDDSDINFIKENREEAPDIRNLISPDHIELTPMRMTIAKRLTSAKRDIPHFYLRQKARVDKLLSAREVLNKILKDKSIKISLNDMIIKAVGQALLNNPNCNVTWDDNSILKAKVSDIAIAVAIEDGLLTPVIRNVTNKSLSSISLETKELIERSKAKKLKPDEYSGGTMTISNLGMMGINSFDAIINPPHGSILAIGTIETTPAFDEEDIVCKANIMNLTLSVDHRVIDGATGAAFLNDIVSFLEEPITLVS